MKSVQFRPQHSSKPINAKSKLTSNIKNAPKSIPDKQNEYTFKSGVCDSTETFSSDWLPKRDWHEFLSSKPQALTPPNLQPPPLTLDPIPLPTVHFCSAERDSAPVCAPSIADLCDQDKRKIALLVEELAKYKQEKAEDEDIILNLKSKVSKLKATLKTLEEEQQAELTALSSLKSQHYKEQSALKDQLKELNQLLAEVQTQKIASEDQTRRIASQAEKMTQAIHTLHAENGRLKKVVAAANEMLKTAQLAVDKMTKHLQEVQERLNPETEDKACQSVEDLTVRGHVKTKYPSNEVERDQELLTELFFNKSFQNEFSSRETIIFLPADTKLPFT